MKKINAVNQIVISKETISKILENYDITEFDYQEINEGIDNSSVFVSTDSNKYVLRIYRRLKKSNSMIQLELDFQEYLAKHNLPIPQVYLNNQGEQLTIVAVNNTEWQVILMKYMGKTDFTHYTDKLIGQMAKIQATMHLLGVEFGLNQRNHERALLELKDRIREEINWDSIIGNKVKIFIKEGQNFYIPLNNTLTFGYNHLDFDAEGNVLTHNEDVTAILDFDDLSYSPCIVCLGYSLWHVLYRSEDEKLVKKYIQEYITVRKLSREEYAMLPQIMLFRNHVIGVLELTIRKNIDNVKYIMSLEDKIKKLQFNN